MNNFSKSTLLFCLAALTAAATPITINFTDPVFSLLPGQTDVAVFGTLTNTDLVNAAFLNGDNLNLPDAITVNDEFFTNVPLSLDPGQTSPFIELFRFDVAPDAAGTLTATYQLLGGIGVGNQFNFDPLGSQTFTVSINQGVPEPASFLLLGCGFLGISLLMRRTSAARNR